MIKKCFWQSNHIWEIKHEGTSLSKATEQLNRYTGLTGFSKGYDISIYDIKLFGKYKMNINSVMGKPGILQYTFSKKSEKQQIQEELATASEVQSAYYKVYAAAMAPFLIIMGATVIEDVASLGSGILDDIPSLVAALKASLSAVALVVPVV